MAKARVRPAHTRGGTKVQIPWRSLIPALVMIAVVGLFVLLELRAPAPNPGRSLSGQLDTVKEKTLDTVLDLTKLFMTWSLGVIGAMAYFLKAALEGKVTLNRGRLIAAELVILSSVFSLFFGHLVFNSVLNMLALDLFSVQDSSLVTYSIAQYATFLASVVLFGLYVHFTYWPSYPEPQIAGGERS